MTRAIEQVEIAELVPVTTDPFVQHQVDPATVIRAWRRGRAVVIAGGRGRPHERLPGPVYTCLGPVDDLAPLMEELAGSAQTPWRVTNVRGADDHMPARWRRGQVRRWHWMLTETAPATAVCEVEEVSQSADLNRLLDQANDGSYARPGAPGIECWLGVRREGLLLGAGALMRLPSSAGHLRGIAVLERARRQGIGTAVSAELTRRGLANGSPVCTLGVYTHNAAAIAMYRRLGYDVVHTFTSGEVLSPG